MAANPSPALHKRVTETSTAVGGNTFVNTGSPGYGVIYQLTPSGAYTVLHNFTAAGQFPNLDGQNPACQLIQGLSTDNNLYGTARRTG